MLKKISAQSEKSETTSPKSLSGALYGEKITSHNEQIDQITDAIQPIKSSEFKRKSELELVFVKHYAPNCLTLTLFDSNTA